LNIKAFSKDSKKKMMIMKNKLDLDF